LYPKGEGAGRPSVEEVLYDSHLVPELLPGSETRV
jgi:hypothetical protein